MRIRLFFLVLMASFGYFTLGLALAWPASALPSIRASLNLTLEQQSWVGSSPSFGGFVGSVLSGFTAKTLGARRGILLCSVVACLGWFLVFLAASLSLIGALFPGIFLIGFSCGFSNPLTSVYVSETVGWGNKGMVTAMFNCQITFGIMATNVLGVILGWLFNSLLLGLLHFGFCLVLFIFLPITPYELVRSGNVEGLSDLLKTLRGEDEESIGEETAFIIGHVRGEKEKPGLAATLKNLNRRRMLSVFMTTIYSKLSGIDIVTAYLIDIFASSINSLTLALISSFTIVICACLQMLVADTLGRKVFLVLCACGMGIGAIVFAGIFWVSSHAESLIFGNAILNELLTNNVLVVVTLILFVGSFNFGFAPIRYTLLSELFEPREQELIGSLDHSTYWLFGFTVTKLFLLVSSQFGLTTIFIGVACICFSSVLFTIVVIPETRVKTGRMVQQGSTNEGYALD